MSTSRKKNNLLIFLANLVENRVEIRKLAGADLTLAQKVYKVIKEVFEKVKAFFSGRSVDNAEIKKRYKALQMFEQEIAKVKNNARENVADNKSETKTERKETAGKFEIKKDKYGKEYWHIEDTKDLFKNMSDGEAKSAAFKLILSAAKADTVIKNIDGEQIKFLRLSAEEFVYGPLSTEISKIDKEEYAGELGFYNKKMRMSPSISDLVKMATVKYHTIDHKNHKLFKEKGFNNYRGRVRIDNIIFNYIVRVGKAPFGDVFYDIKLEVDQILPSSNGTSEIQKSTSNDIRLSQDNQNVKPSDEKTSGNNKDMQNGGKYSLKDRKAAEQELFKADKAEKEKFASQVDKWMRGEMKSSDIFELGRTPVVLKELGADELPVKMSQDVIVKMTGGKHNIAIDDIKQITDAIADPIMVFKSASVNNAFVILTELIDKSGDDVVVALHLNRFEGFNRINRVASVYGKEYIGNFVDKQTELGNLKYFDKNKSQDWLRSRGLQLPKLNTILNSTNSILQKEDIVNKYFNQNERRYSLKGVDTLGEFNKLTEQDRALKAKLDVKDRLIMDRRATMGQARRMVKDFGSRAKAGDVEEKIYSLYNKMLRGGDSKGPMAFNDFQKEARGIASEILKNVGQK